MSPAARGLVQSVQTRLLNHARASGMDPNSVLARYGLERFLHRLARSTHADRFVLKGDAPACLVGRDVPTDPRCGLPGIRRPLTVELQRISGISVASRSSRTARPTHQTRCALLRFALKTPTAGSESGWGTAREG